MPLVTVPLTARVATSNPWCVLLRASFCGDEPSRRVLQEVTLQLLACYHATVPPSALAECDPAVHTRCGPARR